MLTQMEKYGEYFYKLYYHHNLDFAHVSYFWHIYHPENYR